jgi:WhiB family redox-sensing transcriptional regulator
MSKKAKTVIGHRGVEDGVRDGFHGGAHGAHDLGVLPDRAGESAVPDWRVRAACRGVELNLFFGPLRESAAAKMRRILAAKRVCAQCPVREPCLEFALAQREEFGVWGGMTEGERRQLLAKRPKRRRATRHR